MSEREENETRRGAIRSRLWTATSRVVACLLVGIGATSPLSAKAEVVTTWLANNGGRPVDIYGNRNSYGQMLAIGAVFGRLSEIAYESKSTQQNEVADVRMKHRAFLDGGADAQVMVVEDNKAVVVVARGSESPLDWLVNTSAATVPLPGYGDVHLGFGGAATGLKNTVVSRVADSLADRPSREVWLAGHSLGGAMAVILAAWLEKEGHDIGGVVTFGAPAAGSSTWRTAYNAKLGSVTHRWVRGEDIVPCLPAAQDFWRHVGDQHYLPDTGTFFFDTTNHCADFPDIFNPAAAMCERESKAARWLRRIFLDPANILCGPDPAEALLNTVFNAIDGRGFGDHASESYTEALVERMGSMGDLLVRR